MIDNIIEGFFDWFAVLFLVTILGMMCAAPDMPDSIKTFLAFDVTFLVLCATPDVHILG